jgi:hypothetical protein
VFRNCFVYQRNDVAMFVYGQLIQFGRIASDVVEQWRIVTCHHVAVAHTCLHIDDVPGIQFGVA